MGITSKDDRGHNAKKARQIPIKGWKDIALSGKEKESGYNSTVKE